MTRYLVGVVILYVAIIIITILALHSSTTRQLVVGSFCVVMGIGMYAAPLSVMVHLYAFKLKHWHGFHLNIVNKKFKLSH